MSQVDAVLSQLDRVRRSGAHSWSARCPAHEDRSPSLAVRETDDGRVLLHCFGGCSVDSVLGAIGLQMEDLFPPRPQSAGGGHQRERRPWRAGDLLRLAAFETTIALLVARDVRDGRAVSDADMDRMSVAVGRLEDIKRATFDV